MRLYREISTAQAFQLYAQACYLDDSENKYYFVALLRRNLEQHGLQHLCVLLLRLVALLLRTYRRFYDILKCSHEQRSAEVSFSSCFRTQRKRPAYNMPKMNYVKSTELGDAMASRMGHATIVLFQDCCAFLLSCRESSG